MGMSVHTAETVTATTPLPVLAALAARAPECEREVAPSAVHTVAEGPRPFALRGRRQQQGATLLEHDRAETREWEAGGGGAIWGRQQRSVAAERHDG